MTVDVLIQAQGQNVCVDLVCINGSAYGSFRFFVSGSALVSGIELFGLVEAGALHRELVFENTGPHEAYLTPRMELFVSGLNEETAAPPIPEIDTHWMMALGLVAAWASRRYKCRGA